MDVWGPGVLMEVSVDLSAGLSYWDRVSPVNRKSQTRVSVKLQSEESGQRSVLSLCLLSGPRWHWQFPVLCPAGSAGRTPWSKPQGALSSPTLCGSSCWHNPELLAWPQILLDFFPLWTIHREYAWSPLSAPFPELGFRGQIVMGIPNSQN